MAQQQSRQKKNQTVRLPLMGAYSNRGYSGTKDQRFVNAFPETRKVDQLENTKIFINKRPGLTLYRDYGTGEGRGAAYFNGKFYVIIGNTVYEDAVSPVSKVTLTNSTGPVGMIVGNSSSTGDYLFICDGTKGWKIDTSGTVTEISNSSVLNVTVTSGGTGYVSTPTVTFSAPPAGVTATGTASITGGVVTDIHIDNPGSGYVTAPTITFSSGAAVAVANLNSFPSPHIPSPTFIDGYILLAKGSDVYNCVLDTPTSWDASNFLSAEMFPDPIRALARQNNQVIVLGGSSIEFFYDAANVSGSPLSRNDSTTIQMGVAAPYAIYQNEKACIYISQSDSGGRAAWIIEGFQPRKISDEYIERILDSEVDMTDCRGFGLRTKGHMFYILNLKTINRTLVYDIDEKLWHEWSTNNAGNHSVFAYDHMTDNMTGAAYLLHTSDGTLSKLDVDNNRDVSTDILFEIVTNKYDMDSYNRKFMSLLRIVGDRYATANTVDVSWSDDDYQTWSNTKTISLSDDYPAFQRLGSYRRRAFRIKHASNNPLRLESIECTYTEGDT